jgi:hypothetical protein
LKTGHNLCPLQGETLGLPPHNRKNLIKQV